MSKTSEDCEYEKDVAFERQRRAEEELMEEIITVDPYPYL